MNDGQLSIRVVHDDDDVIVITLAGQLDIHTSPGFRDAMGKALRTGAERVMVDAQKVTFMDSSGLGVFVGGERQVRRGNGRLAIACDDPTVMRAFEISGLRRVLTVRENRAEARRLAAG